MVIGEKIVLKVREAFVASGKSSKKAAAEYSYPRIQVCLFPGFTWGLE